MWLLGFIGSKVGKLVALTLAALSVLGAVFVAGRRDANKDHEIDWLYDFHEGQKRINNAKVHNSPADARKRMRRNGQFRE